MSEQIVLASGSAIRAQMLENANVPFSVRKVPVDEVTIRDSLVAENTKPRDIADTLAEMKARRAGQKQPDAMVVGCDQILDLDGEIFAKPTDREQARQQLTQLRGKQHRLHSAAVIYQNGGPIWRHVSEVKLTMHPLSDRYLETYLDRNWPRVATSVGAYQIESEGIRLFSRIDGDHFAILGLPLTQLLSFLALRGIIDQ